MNITELCNERRATLLPRWTELFFAAYPLDGPGFLRTQTDPFANPVGRIVRESLPVLYDAAAGNDVEPDAVHAALADLMRLRAVQDMPPGRRPSFPVSGWACRMGRSWQRRLINC